MTNPLLNVPLNTKQAFIMAKTPGGCEIFMPVDTEDADVMVSTRNDLQEHLNAAYPLPILDPPPKQLA